MTGNRFAHLSLDDGNGKENAPRAAGKKGKGKGQGKGSPPPIAGKSHPTSFTWSVLTEPSVNRTAPRGLVNSSNFCYLNAVLQPLLLCQPFVNLIANLQDRIKPERHKWLAAFLELIRLFREDCRSGSVSPACVYKCWEHSDDQEDAEEFLRLVLNGLHEELLKYRDDLQWSLPTLKDDTQQLDKATVDDQWMSVGKGQRMATARSLIEPPTPISVLFNGQFKTIVKGSGSKDSHVFEPFQFLPLDITEQMTDLKQAIGSLMAVERVSPKMSKQTLIERIPPILVLQLKRFVFNQSTFQVSKSFTNIAIQDELDLSDCIQNFSDSIFFDTDKRPIYRLQSVVYHMGKSTHGGHYTCHVRHDGGWFYCDDGCISRASSGAVGLTERNRTPYLLFYIRTTE